VFDPIFEDPAEPRWVRFCAELLPRARARQRFLTPFFRQFLVG